MEKFDYKILNVSRSHLKNESFQSELMEKLNELGSEGWELITIEGLTGTSIFGRLVETVDLLFILKRKRIE
jgi:hypothetical protein